MKYLNDTQTARLWAKIKAGFVSKSGDTMTGALTLAGDPVSDLQAATKKYVDDNAGSGGGTAKIWTGYCNTAADVVPKVVVLDDPTGFSLDEDTRIAIRFSNGIEIPSTVVPSINVNDTGIKSLMIPKGINNFVDDRNKLICARGETCLFSYHPGLGVAGGWVLETSGLLLSKAYDTADAALPKAGGTMTGALALSGAPTADLHAATKKYVDDNAGALPSQTGQSGKFLTTDGTDASWGEVDSLPSQTGQSGKFLTTDGTDASWGDPLNVVKPAYELSINDNVATVLDSSLSAVHFLDVVTSFGYSRDVIFTQHEGYYTIIYELFSVESDTQSLVFINLDGDTVRVVSVAETNDGLVGTYSTVSGQSKITASGLLKCDGNGGVTAATAGTDYAAADHTHSGYVPTSRTVNGKALSSDITLSASDVSALPASTAIPSKTSDLTNDSGFITGYTETDPTVPSWAKQSSKPSYTASEVGAVPTSRTVNGKALSSDISLSASDVGALPSSTTIPTASTTNPSMDGTASYGSGTVYARSNHVHPTDTSRQAKITASGLLKGDGSGGVSAAVAGTDYIASHQDISGKLDKSGGTMTGALTLSGAPTSNLHAATKKYVDDYVGDIETLLASI